MVKGLDCLGIVFSAAGPGAGVGLGGECLGFEDDAVTADDCCGYLWLRIEPWRW